MLLLQGADYAILERVTGECASRVYIRQILGYFVNRNTTISIIMLINLNNWSLQEQYCELFPIFATTKTNGPMYTKTELKNEKMTINQKKVESSVKKPMPSIWYT